MKRIETAREKATGVIFRVKKYALHDGPGIRTTVFFKGCPLKCRWCHNPEGISPDPQPMDPAGTNDSRGAAIIGEKASAGQVMAEIRKDLIFYDESGGGATFSGGEPLMQPAFLLALLGLCRAEEIHTAVDTSGFAPAEIMTRVAQGTDLILFDLKIMDEALHRRHTGVSNKPVLENLAITAESGTPVRIRFPLIPGITDGAENIRKVAETVLALNRLRRLDLLPFHATADGKYRRLGMVNPMAGVQPPDDRAIEKAKQEFEAFGISVHIGG